MKNLFLTLFLFAGIPCMVTAQDLVEAEFLVSFTKADLQADFGSLVEYGADLYKILYTTPDVHGVQDTASGLLVIPNDASFSYPLLCYQHGTVSSREDVPSNLQGGYQLALVFAALGYITTAADYLGLGESRGFHPYVHADSEAWAAVDLLFAAQEFMDGEDIAYHNQLFITGYSQGGHASMAAHKLVEESYSDDFDLAAASHMSGPYDISGAMTEYTLGDNEYFFPAYLANVALSYQTVYGIYDELDQFFKPDFAVEIQQYYEESIDLGELNTFMIDKLTQDYGASIPKFMLQDSVLNSLLNDPNHPASQALAANDIYDWTPLAPTRIVYCQADDQVYYRNSVIADSVMKANGALLVDKNNVDPGADHGGCVEPATNFTLIFFGLIQQVFDLVSVSEQNQSQLGLSLQPNPATDKLEIFIDGLISNDVLIQIQDLSGRIVLSQKFPSDKSIELNVNDLPQGWYAVQIQSENKVGRQIFLKQ